MGFLSTVAPGLAAKRAEYRLIEARATESLKIFSGNGGGFEGAKTSRMRGSARDSGARSVDEDNQIGPWNREVLQLEGEHLRRNNPVISGSLTRWGTLVVGDGITAKARSDDDVYNAEADDFWKDFKIICDASGRLDLDEICEVIIRQSPIDGDGGSVLMKNGQISMVEAARIAASQKLFKKQGLSGRLVDGVHVTTSGFKRGYYVAPRKPTGMVDDMNARYIPYWNFIHYARDRFRLDTIRGIGDLAPVINQLKDFAKLHEYTINKAKLDATQGGLMLNLDGGGSPGGHIMGRNDRVEDGDSVQKVQKIQGIEIHHMRAGDYKSLASNTPNAQYVEFAELIMRLVGAGLGPGIPYEFLLLDFKQGSYQANRTATLTLQNTINYFHRWLVGDFLGPLWNWRMYKAIAEGDIRPPPVDRRGISQFHKVEFSHKPIQFLDPRHDMTALKDAWNLNETSLDQRARMHGETRESRIREKGADIAAAMAEAQRLTEKYNQPVSWEQIMNASTPGITFTTPSNGSENTNSDDESDDEEHQGNKWLT